MLVARLNSAARRLPTWVIYLLALAPLPWFFYLAAMGQMGVEPIKALEHEYGEIALKMLVVGLAITPLRSFTGLNLIRFRRAIGLSAFAYVCSHLAVWLFLDVQILSQIWADIVKRPYITIGMAAFALMIPLAVTSNNRAIRALGPKWHHLHRLTYLVVVLGAVHFLWVRKGFQLEPWLYLVVIVLLLAPRIGKLSGLRNKARRVSSWQPVERE